MPPIKHVRNVSKIYVNLTILLKRYSEKNISDPALPVYVWSIMFPVRQVGWETWIFY